MPTVAKLVNIHVASLCQLILKNAFDGSENVLVRINASIKVASLLNIRGYINLPEEVRTTTQPDLTTLCAFITWVTLISSTTLKTMVQ